MNSYTDQFPVLANYTYLNTASSGVLPLAVKEWRAQHDQDFLEHASVFREPHKDHIEQIRETMAAFCGAFLDDIALVPNWSFGFNTILEGVEDHKSCLLLEGDYPSINWPVENHGLRCVYAKIDFDLEDNIREVLAKETPDIFAFSLTQYINGITLSLDFLREIKKLYPAMLLIADGTQYVGTRPFNFNESPLDILGFSGYKWLMAGYGVGCMMIKQSAKEQLFLKTIGFNSASYIFSHREQAPFNKLLEPGHHDTLNFGSLMRSVQILEKIGLENIYEHITSLRAYAIEQLLALGFINPKIQKRSDHGPILSITSAPGLFAYLRENNILCSERGEGIRISFHFYNNKKDLDVLFQALKDFSA
ncbi:MAG: aminotransferase class V-fold PLP-dependent enzyme [Gilvibacter sp.]